MEQHQTSDKDDFAHFKGKDAAGHIAEVRAKGVITSTEDHGLQTPSTIAAACDAAKETAIIALIITGLLTALTENPLTVCWALIIFIGAWSIWKGGKKAWISWSRLERLHRILEQERYEIVHNREQEREELKVLYAAKGFEGKLLEDVLDVLMADQDRLLRVMAEEELGLSLEIHEHPLEQAFAAFLAVIATGAVLVVALFFGGFISIIVAAAVVVALSAGIFATYEQNKWTPAIVWSLGLAAISLAIAHFLGVYLPTIH